MAASVVLMIASPVLMWLTGGDKLSSTVALGLNIAALAAVMVAVSSALTGSGVGFAISGLNRYSLSRAQMGAWTIVVLAMLLTAAEWNLIKHGGLAAASISVPGALLAALGISYASGIAAPAILSVREATTAPPSGEQLEAARDRIATFTGRDQAASLVNRNQVVGNNDAIRASWKDLFSGEEVAVAGRVDLSKVQQALLTAILIGTYLGAAVTMFSRDPITTLPGFSEDAARLLAISHAGYLAYKAVPKPDTSGLPLTGR